MTDIQTTTNDTPDAPELNETQRVILAMLRENTGRHFLDSGGAYGRSWERNQTRDLVNAPASTLEARVYTHRDTDETTPELSVTHSVFHWLSDRLEYAPELDAVFQRFADWPTRTDEGCLLIMRQFADLVCKHEARAGNDAGGLYKDGPPRIVNTYNGEDLLSQTIQYCYLDTDTYGEIVILQIHGGCDVRGGYTRPRVFVGNGHSDLAILDNARASIYCEADREP